MHGADLWKPVVLRSLRHRRGRWRSPGIAGPRRSRIAHHQHARTGWQPSQWRNGVIARGTHLGLGARVLCGTPSGRREGPLPVRGHAPGPHHVHPRRLHVGAADGSPCTRTGPGSPSPEWWSSRATPWCSRWPIRSGCRARTSTPTSPGAAQKPRRSHNQHAPARHQRRCGKRDSAAGRNACRWRLSTSGVGLLDQRAARGARWECWNVAPGAADRARQRLALTPVRPLVGAVPRSLGRSRPVRCGEAAALTRHALIRRRPAGRAPGVAAELPPAP
jgi:hypothetical protein